MLADVSESNPVAHEIKTVSATLRTIQELFGSLQWKQIGLPLRRQASQLITVEICVSMRKNNAGIRLASFEVFENTLNIHRSRIA